MAALDLMVMASTFTRALITGQFPTMPTTPQVYGGPLVFFTNIAANDNSGTVNIIGGLANGSTTYFSLEENVDLNLVASAPSVPEPASLGIVGTALVGFGLMRRRRQGA
jgi:hypothetical protein